MAACSQSTNKASREQQRKEALLYVSMWSVQFVTDGLSSLYS